MSLPTGRHLDHALAGKVFELNVLLRASALQGRVQQLDLVERAQHGITPPHDEILLLGERPENDGA